MSWISFRFLEGEDPRLTVRWTESLTENRRQILFKMFRDNEQTKATSILNESNDDPDSYPVVWGLWSCHSITCIVTWGPVVLSAYQDIVSEWITGLEWLWCDDWVLMSDRMMIVYLHLVSIVNQICPHRLYQTCEKFVKLRYNTTTSKQSLLIDTVYKTTMRRQRFLINYIINLEVW